MARSRCGTAPFLLPPLLPPHSTRNLSTTIYLGRIRPVWNSEHQRTAWVTDAKQDAAKHDPVPGKGDGFVDVFDTDGNLIGRFAQRGLLNAPWGMVLTPDHFGEFTNDILIGNFGDGKISDWEPKTADFIDVMRNDKGKPIDSAHYGPWSSATAWSPARRRCTSPPASSWRMTVCSAR